MLVDGLFPIGLDLNDLAIFVKKEATSGRMTTKPEITARTTKTGKNLGKWLGVTSIRDER
jgi:hypothetical protein